MNTPRIVLMGTPEFAVGTLRTLIRDGFDIAGVVTVPDKPAGRGRKLASSPVKAFAESHSLVVLQPSKLRDQSFIESLRNLKGNVFIVVAFRMLPKAVWKLPSYGTINLHASLLPQYRGAAPINHAIINGETVTGVTTFLIDDKIDTGNILLRKGVPVRPDDNAGDLHDRLMEEGASLVSQTIKGLFSGNLQPRNQSEFVAEDEILKPAPKITPEFCTIDWNKEPAALHNFVRGLSPYPCARTIITEGGQPVSVKIYESKPEIEKHSHAAGIFFSDGRNILKVSCRNGYLNILSLQPEGRKRMSSSDFLRGFRGGSFRELV